MTLEEFDALKPHEKVLAVRNVYEVSRQELATLLGVDRTTVNRWELGTKAVSPIALKVLRWITACPGRPADWPPINRNYPGRTSGIATQNSQE